MRPGKRLKRTMMASIMLVAFVSCALIPPGFMPENGHPFSLEICWEGLATHRPPMDMPSMGSPAGQSDTGRRTSEPASHHHGSPSHSDHCVFGTACSAGPIPHLPLPSDFSGGQQLRAIGFATLPLAVRIVHLPQARAPPRRLS